MVNDSKSEGPFFYSPDFKSMIGSAEYTLNPTPPSGSTCEIPYDDGVMFGLHYNEDNNHCPLAY